MPPAGEYVVISTEMVMSISRNVLLVLFAFGMLPFGGCASLQGREPIHVVMVRIEPPQGEGLELRMLVKLRIHPGSTALPRQPCILEVSVSSEALAQHRHDT